MFSSYFFYVPEKKKYRYGYIIHNGYSYFFYKSVILNFLNVYYNGVK